MSTLAIQRSHKPTPLGIMAAHARQGDPFVKRPVMMLEELGGPTIMVLRFVMLKMR